MFSVCCGEKLLKNQFQRELDLPGWGPGLVNHTGAAVHAPALSQGLIKWHREIGAVHQIKKLRPELQIG